MWPTHRPSPYDVSVGFSAVSDDRVREVFVTAHRTTTELDISARDLATIISIALQHGATIGELSGAVCRNEDDSPQGLAGAVLDAVSGRAA
jgi:hypothetical protein